MEAVAGSFKILSEPVPLLRPYQRRRKSETGKKASP